MTEFIARRASDRKRRLFACACCRTVWTDLTDERSRRAVEVAERYADGLASDEELVDAHSECVRVEYPFRFLGDAPNFACEDAFLADLASFYVRQYEAYRSAYEQLDNAGREELLHSPDEAWEGQANLAGHELQAGILRDIFGNPFRPVALDPRWLTSAVVNLSRAIYDERAFDRLPILADALMDAGCDDEQVLGHCRGPGPHVRGCWVVDLLLGKE